MNDSVELNNTFKFNGITWRLIAALVLIIAAVFARGITTQFVDLDDGMYVFNNPHVRGGLTRENVEWAFTLDDKIQFWIPLTFLSLQMDASLSSSATVPLADPGHRVGGAAEPLPVATVYKIHNLILHVIATIMLFLFCYRATKLRWPAFILAVLWGIHPLRVESVAWVTERKDMLAGAWGFLALFVYVGWKERGGWMRYAGVCAAFVLSFMAKPMFVTLPALLVLVDVWPLRRIQGMKDVWKSVLEKWLLFLLSIGMSILTVMGQHAAPVGEFSLIQRLETAVTGYLAYVVRQVRVWDLGVYYPYNYHIPMSEIVTAVIVLGGITGVCIAQRRRRLWLLMGWLWFLISLLPMIGLKQSGYQAYADRFSYLPAVGLFIMAVFTGYALLVTHPKWKRNIIFGAAVAGIFFAGYTTIQLMYWKDSITILSRTVEVTRNNYRMLNALGGAFLREGENAKAVDAYLASVQANPLFGDSWISVGYLHVQLKDYEKAIPELDYAIRTLPGDWHPVYEFGNALYLTGRFDLAIAAFKETLRLNPGYKPAAERLQMAIEDKAAMEKQLRERGAQP